MSLAGVTPERLLDVIAVAMRQNPAPGLTVAYVDSFFARLRPQLLAVIKRLVPGLAPSLVAPDVWMHDLPPDLWTPAKRTEANLKAMEMLAERKDKLLTDADRKIVAQYSGWGGLSIERVADRFPVGFPAPDARGLIHEYYTPTRVVNEVNRVLTPYLPGIIGPSGIIEALEPSAGIGRFPRAFASSTVPIQWTLVELSETSALLLKALFPRANVENMPFERVIYRILQGSKAGHQVQGFNLILANPPYGTRGAYVTEDPDGRYRMPQAYIYFVLRASQLLLPNGIAVFLIPSGFMTGSSRRESRELILKSNHLMAAFRLPSQAKDKADPLFPGANLVTDLVFLRARSGRLKTVLSSDQAILEGRYFEEIPQHILGEEIDRTNAEWDEREPKPRLRYAVVGDFTGLPDFEERALEAGTYEEHDDRIVVGTKRTVTRDDAAETEGMPQHVAVAQGLGKRVDEYLKLATTEESEQALGLWSELVDALTSWLAKHGSPWANQELRRITTERGDVFLNRFIQAYTRQGDLIDGLRTKPRFEPRWGGKLNDVVGIASYMYRQHRGLKLKFLQNWVQARGFTGQFQLKPLFDAGWCLDGDDFNDLYPADEYYSGHLWPKYDRAEARAKGHNDPQAKAQALRLKMAIAPKLWEEFGTSSAREAWIPTDILNRWLKHLTNTYDAPDLVWDNGLLTISGIPYERLETGGRLEQQLHKTALWFIGSCNNDFEFFDPDSFPDGTKKTKEQKKDEYRLKWKEHWDASFRKWLEVPANFSYQEQLLEVYHRRFQGFVQPPENKDPLPIARWSTKSHQLKPHQVDAARKLLTTRGGLLAFDVGVGKTYTGMAVVARARQEGWVRRPVIVVPNSIIWKWYADFQRVLPDYRVGVIGSKKRWIHPAFSEGTVALKDPNALSRWNQTNPRGRAGRVILTNLTESGGALAVKNMAPADNLSGLNEIIRQLDREGFVTLNLPASRASSSVDSPEERAQTWTRFQAGELEVVLLTYTALSRTQMNERAVVAYAANKQAIAREIALRKRAALARFGTRSFTERDQAILNEGVRAFVAENLEIAEDHRFDPGIAWDDLGIDMLVVDEAQNFKNLYLPEPREFGVPRFLGNPGDGSKRAWQLDFRASTVRTRTGGAGVVLLSATPAKNSPLELYNLVQLVDGDAWSRAGMPTPEHFIDRFCKLERKDVLNSTMDVEMRLACTGFHNLDDLRSIYFRYADTRTAEQVGIRLPEPKVNVIEVDMDARQEAKYADMVAVIEESEAGPKILGLLARMAMVAIHADLDQGYKWENADAVEEKGSPKIRAVAARIANSMYQYDLLTASNLNGDVQVGPPIMVSPGNLNVVAYGEAENGAVLIESYIDKSWRLVTEVEVTGRFKISLDEITLKRSTMLRARVEGINDVTVVANLGTISSDAVCQIPWGNCRCGHIIFCDNTAVHKWMRDVLVEYGIPKERIAILNAKSAPAADRARIAREFNGSAEENIAPIYDVVIANQVAYEGVDLQERTCAIHHIDLPWEPATLQQRNGRGVRQGNRLSAIEINYYFARRSSDGIRFNMIQGKRGWMIALIESQDRETNNPGAQMEMTPEQVLVLLSRNPEQTAQRLASLRETREKERRQKFLKDVVKDFGAANRHFRRAEEESDLDEARARRELGEKLLKGLLNTDPQVWPWAGHAAKMRELDSTIIEGATDGAVLYPGLKLLLNTGRPIEIGKCFKDTSGNRVMAFREAGTSTWGVAALQMFQSLTIASISADWPANDVAETERRTRGYLQATFGDGNWNARSWWAAPDAWIERMWASHGRDVLMALNRAQPNNFLQVPWVNDENQLKVWRPRTALPVDLVIAPTPQGFQRLLDLSADSGMLYGHLNTLTIYWWGRPFPRGHLAEVSRSREAQAQEAQAPQEELAALREPIRSIRSIRFDRPIVIPGRPSNAIPKGNDRRSNTQVVERVRTAPSQASARVRDFRSQPTTYSDSLLTKLGPLHKGHWVRVIDDSGNRFTGEIIGFRPSSADPRSDSYSLILNAHGRSVEVHPPMEILEHRVNLGRDVTSVQGLDDEDWEEKDSDQYDADSDEYDEAPLSQNERSW